MRARTVVLFFLVVLAVYLALFYGMEYLRRRKGPWIVDFRATTDGAPAIVVSQATLGISNVTLIFHGEKLTNVPGRVMFDQVKKPVPIGRVLYEDLTFLPGVVTFDLYGHEIELLPRVLIGNKAEIRWQSGASVDLWPTNKPAIPPQPPKAR
jgi:hypothetical protein